MRLTIAQINPTIGDMLGNARLHIQAAARAREADSELVVFPELSLTGYSPADMLEEPGFGERVDAALSELLAASRQMPALHWVVGLPTEHVGPGKQWENSLVVLKAGAVVLRYSKQLLPTYDVFSERRYFEPGPDVACVLRIGGAQVGLLICEDAWNVGATNYAVDPFTRLAQAAPDLVISINASPSDVGKRAKRHAVMRAAATGKDLPLLYVNQVGGHDDLVFDGGSFAMQADGEVVFESRRFESAVEQLQFDVNSRTFRGAGGRGLEAVSAEGLTTSEFYRQQIILGLRDYARRCGFAKAVVGCSGGIDSALTLALAVEALGASNVEAITMPSVFSSAGSVEDSEVLCRRLGVALKEMPIKAMVDEFQAGWARARGVSLSGVALENLQARIRANILMAHSNTYGSLLLTTGNKSEMSVGYCTLYGDMSGGLGLIGDIYKTEVFALARHLNSVGPGEVIPVAIIEKPPSAELAPGQLDTDSLPPYEVLDEILRVIIEGDRLYGAERQQASGAVAELERTGAGRALVARVRSMVARNEYKRRQAAPVVRVRARAFGAGRQLPIAAVYQTEIQ